MSTFAQNKGQENNRKRLITAAEYVADLSVGGKKPTCADIGCDHGYLAIHLIRSGIADKVYACDINEKPLSIAKINIERAGLSDKIQLVLTDGLCGLPEKTLDFVIICGMGGELICNIIDKGREICKNARLILQPMSRESELRSYLCKNGYKICDETLIHDAGRLYTVISALFTGEVEKYSPCELLLGKKNIEKRAELFYELCRRKKVHSENLLKSDGFFPEYIELDRTLSEFLEEKEK